MAISKADRLGKDPRTGEWMEPEKKDVWEVEFENKFCAWNSKWTWAINSDANPQEVKNFIRQNFIPRAEVVEKIDEERERIRQWALKRAVRCAACFGNKNIPHNHGQDDIADLLDLLDLTQ